MTCLSASAPDLQERPFSVSSTLTTTKYIITGVRVFVAQCACCKVTYLPFVAEAEGMTGTVVHLALSLTPGLFVFSADSVFALDLLWEWRDTMQPGLSPTASIEATLERLEHHDFSPASAGTAWNLL